MVHFLGCMLSGTLAHDIGVTRLVRKAPQIAKTIRAIADHPLCVVVLSKIPVNRDACGRHTDGMKFYIFAFPKLASVP